MKLSKTKKFLSLLAVLAVIISMTLPALPGQVAYAEESEKGADSEETSAPEKAPDTFEGFDLDEGFAIVPVHAGASALDVSASDHTTVQLYKQHRGSNQTWTLKKEISPLSS